MTAAPMTPPQYLFRELTDLGNLIFGMLTGPHVTVRRWPAYYMVYLEVDQLCRELSRTAGYFSLGFIKPDGTVNAHRIAEANACLARIDAHYRTAVDLLVRIDFHQLVSYDKPALKTIVAYHFSPKSGWYQAFQAHYCAGRVSSDGRVLKRTVLPIDSHPAFGIATTEGEGFVEPQTLELVSEHSRTFYGRTIRDVQTRLNQVYEALGSFFVDRCPSARELLHPWST